jgi:hypothetical protein
VEVQELQGLFLFRSHSLFLSHSTCFDALFPDGGGQVADGSSESQLPVSRLLLCLTSKGVRRRV